jgi:biopolymer transport protein TolR
MAGKLSAAQMAVINRKAKPKEVDPADEGGELNIVPFLDIVTNVLMFLLATITTIFTATIAVPAPSQSHGAPSQQNDEVNITVKIVREGYIVGAPGGFLQPGCTAVSSAALTVPLVNGQHDGEGLTRCMQAIRNNPEWRRELESRRNIQIAGNGDIPYNVLVRTLDAVRESRPGANDLFTEPALGILQ